MINRPDIFGSVEDIWVMWLASVVALALLTRRLVAGFRRRDFRRLAVSEKGLAYSLVYVLTFPFYMFLLSMVIETTLILIVKMGTVYATYAAARSWIVWQPVNAAVATEKMHLAATHAMTPFASSDREHGKKIGAKDRTSRGAADYVKSFNRYAHATNTTDYLIAKYNYAYQATVESASPQKTRKPNEPVTVTLSFQMPLRVPGVTLFLANHKQNGFATRTITTDATLPMEAPEDPQGNAGHLGIDYVPE